MAHYQPPKQGKASQLFDVVVLVVLTVGALFVPLWLGMVLPLSLAWQQGLIQKRMAAVCRRVDGHGLFWEPVLI